MKKFRAKNSFFIAALLIIIAGCGYKGNPVPYPLVVLDRKPVIKNTEALAVQDTVVLKWTFQDKSGIIRYINIERSDVGERGNECKDCPQTFNRIGQVTVKDAKNSDKEQVLSFTDPQVVKGHIYNYRLMLCEENANCAEAAKTEINFK